jgi:phospholipase C
VLLVVAALIIASCSSGSSKSNAAGRASTPFSLRAPNPTSDDLRKLEHFVVLMQENRSYDSYFGPLHALGQSDASEEPTTGNPDPTDANGPAIVPFRNPRMCETEDLAHGWGDVHTQIDGGKMDGFTATNVRPTDLTGSRAMAYYTDRDLPYYYAFAKTFGIGDRYFASAPGPTYPNRYFLIAATAFGHIDNKLPPTGGWRQRTIFEVLDEGHVSWKVYSAQVSEALLFRYVRSHATGHLATINRYYADAASGSLPQVAFVEPRYIGGVKTQSDEHPPANPQLGEQFSARVLNALMHSPLWSSSAFFLTWDEHGGYYDHVPPPAAPTPDDIPPILPRGESEKFGFDRYGVRVPLLVASPWSRPHFVSHDVHDHTSILRTIELRFALPSLTRRDAQALPLTEFFDFSAPAFKTPPEMPAAPLDPSGVTQCVALHGNN